MEVINKMNLKDYIKKENLIMPNYNNLNIVDLVNYLYNKYRGECVTNDNIKKLANIVKLKKHTVLILIDGMGSNLIDILKKSSLLKRNKVANLLTVSPSSTACVLTSVATGAYPSEHGIIGWYNYNRKYDVGYYPLLFTERKQNKSLKKYNIKSDEIFILNSKLNELKVKTTVLFPDYIYDSTYSNYVANEKIRKSYSTLKDAFDQILKITSDEKETFTYLYIPSIDNLEHDNGFDSEIVLAEMDEIENQIKRLNRSDIVTIVTADHGQTNINKDIVMDFKKYDKYFYSDPGIDFGMATYYVKKELEQEFIETFNKDFKGRMFLFKTSDFIKNKVFGPTKASQYLLDNLGEYISLCNSDSQYINSCDVDEYYGKTKGNHSGLTEDEMIIPLIVIENNNN